VAPRNFNEAACRYSSLRCRPWKARASPPPALHPAKAWAPSPTPLPAPCRSSGPARSRDGSSRCPGCPASP